MVSQVYVPKIGMLNVESEPLTSREEVLHSKFPPDYGRHAKGGIYGKILSQPLLPTSMWFPSHLFNV